MKPWLPWEERWELVGTELRMLDDPDTDMPFGDISYIDTLSTPNRGTLAAAAPDLYRALEAAVKNAHAKCDGDFPFDEADAALRKARGGV